jgi:hypothetical protein
LVTIRFDLTSFPDKIYQWREALERRNLDNATPFTEWSPAIFECRPAQRSFARSARC